MVQPTSYCLVKQMSSAENSRPFGLFPFESLIFLLTENTTHVMYSTVVLIVQILKSQLVGAEPPSLCLVSYEVFSSVSTPPTITFQ